ncbi:MAG: DUF6766 family protein [Spongiibacteraceae bacterium]
MKIFVKKNGLSLALFGCFIAMEVGLSLVGLRQYNAEQATHGQVLLSYSEYLTSPAFLEATMENWESEFLQMFAYVVFTAFLYQQGSSESKTIGKVEDVDIDPRTQRDLANTPWPVRRGGLILKLYENSLSLALFLLFLASFFLHAVSGAQLHSEQQVQHGERAISVWEYLVTSQFWFESLQNWQSEFFSIGLMVVLSIFLRQRGSPESKPVAMPHSESP